MICEGRSLDPNHYPGSGCCVVIRMVNDVGSERKQCESSPVFGFDDLYGKMVRLG